MSEMPKTIETALASKLASGEASQSGGYNRVLWQIALAQLPVGGLLWQAKVSDYALAHPWIVMGGLCIYEGLLFVTAFLFNVWKHELEPEARKWCAQGLRTLASSLWNWARNISPGFRGNYFRCLVREYGLFNDRGLGLINANRLELTQVFVELRIGTSPNPDNANTDLVRRFELQGNLPIWRILRRHKCDAVGLAIIGAPGSGKTTLLQHVLLTFAKNQQWRQLMRAKTPVLVYLRQHATQIASNPALSLAQLVEDQVRQIFPKINCPIGWFEHELTGGRCVVLLDGLDEVASQIQRKQVSTWVDEQIKTFPQCHFLTTSRPQGYRTAPLARAHVLEVQPFDPKQVQLFVNNWYRANEILSSGGKTNLAVRERADKESRALLGALGGLPALNALTANPLLLTMVAMVHRYHGALPGSRVQLYAEICQVLLERWRSAKEVPDDLRGDQKLTVLRPLAAHMMELQTREISTADAMQLIRPYLEQVGLNGAQHDTFLKDLQGSSGLLLERERDQWGFAHLTFQEFLTSAHWLAEKEQPHPWKVMVAKSWWHETLRLYAAQGDATGIVEACLNTNNRDALAMAMDCLVEAQTLSSETRRLAKRRLEEALDAPSTDAGKLAAEVVLARRLTRGFVELSENKQIDTTPVTCAEYQLFIESGGQSEWEAVLEHWITNTFQAGESRKPICGVSGWQAFSFAKWLTRRTGGIWRYRLPQDEELSGPNVNLTSGVAVWKTNSAGFIRHGTAAESNRVGLQAMQNQMRSQWTCTPLDRVLPMIESACQLDTQEALHSQSLPLKFARAFVRAIPDERLIMGLRGESDHPPAKPPFVPLIDRLFDCVAEFCLAPIFPLGRLIAHILGLHQKQSNVIDYAKVGSNVIRAITGRKGTSRDADARAFAFSLVQDLILTFGEDPGSGMVLGNRNHNFIRNRENLRHVLQSAKRQSQDALGLAEKGLKVEIQFYEDALAYALSMNRQELLKHGFCLLGNIVLISCAQLEKKDSNRLWSLDEETIVTPTQLHQRLRQSQWRLEGKLVPFEYIWLVRERGDSASQ